MRFDAIQAGTYPSLIYPPYKSTVKRGPTQAPVRLSAPMATGQLARFSPELLRQNDLDLTAHGTGAPLGEKIVVAGRVLDEDGKPVRNSLVEVWQCNAAGRYRHARDNHPAPIDPNFGGAGRTMTDADGRYEFTTIKPGAYPWGNHPNAWRPAHIHFSCSGSRWPRGS